MRNLLLQSASYSVSFCQSEHYNKMQFTNTMAEPLIADTFGTWNKCPDFCVHFLY